MKTFTSLLIGCALALAGAVIAQQPETQESPTKKGAAKEKPAAAEATPRGKAAAAEKRAAPTASGVQQPPGGRAERVGKGHKAEATAKGATIPGAEATAGAMPTRSEEHTSELQSPD